MRWLLYSYFLISLMTGWSWGQPMSPGKTAPGLLPGTVIPHHYRISLNPDMQALMFTGSECVDIEVLRPTRSVVLNALDLEISQARVDGGCQAVIRHDPATQTATLDFSSLLTPGRHRLSLDFRGTINQSPRGLYYLDYQVPARPEKQRLLATHMQSTEARRLFPAWDEPFFRSSFELHVEIPASMNAVSNMPVRHIAPLKNGRRQVKFAPTPPMSSYLVALCVGDFEQVEDQVKDVQVRMVTTRGKAQQGRYALGVLRQLLPYYEDYTGVAYPLPKLDLIALPGGGGGMENWGAVIALESDLLIDPARSGQITRERVFAMVAHEVAHQWFGNLVTMAWWNDLWLNEGFTCWISDKALEHFNPSWQYSQLRALSYREEALGADADMATHPVLQPVRNYTEASSAYDAITYFKGRGVIAMLEDYLGGETFRTGVQAYVKSHCYSSVTTADLWRALSRASGQDVDRVAGPWVRQEGFPLVKVGPAPGEGRELRQERFTLASPPPSTDTVQWPVPIPWRCLDGVQDSTAITLLTTPRTIAGCAGPLKLNWGSRGFYRVQYGSDDLNRLACAFPRLPLQDRLNLVNDSWALALAGRSPATDYLAFTGHLSLSDGLVVWNQVIAHLNYIDDCYRGSPGAAAWKSHYSRRLEPLFRELGWEGSGDAHLRILVLTNLGKLGHPEVVAGARSRFQDALRGRPVAPELRWPVMMVTGRYADPVTYDRLRQMGQKALAFEDRQLYYSALATALDRGLAQKTLDLALGDELPPDYGIRMVMLGVAREHPDLAWHFFQEHHKALFSRLPAHKGYRIAGELALQLDRQQLLEARRFFETCFPPEAAPVLAGYLKKAGLSDAFRQRELPRIDAWMEQENENGE